MLIAAIYFLNSPGRLFFTYLVPVVPFVWVFDGYISCLRTRTPAELQQLINKAVKDKSELRKWKLRTGSEMHTFPIGKVHWFIATKEED